jgi:mRNA-degrading endonuclease RelE of RelBE toxin-antitoxin system
MTNFLKVPEFDKDLKKLSKKYSSLPEDLENLINAMKSVLPEQLSGVERISRLGSGVTIPVYKVRNFRCKTLQGKGSRSGIRVIYAQDCSEDSNDTILLLEIYYKGNKENEDRDRITQYLQGRDSISERCENEEQE